MWGCLGSRFSTMITARLSGQHIADREPNPTGHSHQFRSVLILQVFKTWRPDFAMQLEHRRIQSERLSLARPVTGSRKSLTVHGCSTLNPGFDGSACCDITEPRAYLREGCELAASCISMSPQQCHGCRTPGPRPPFPSFQLSVFL